MSASVQGGRTGQPPAGAQGGQWAPWRTAAETGWALLSLDHRPREGLKSWRGRDTVGTPGAQPPTGDKPPGKGATLTRTGAAEAEQGEAQTGSRGPGQDISGSVGDVCDQLMRTADKGASESRH